MRKWWTAPEPWLAILTVAAVASLIFAAGWRPKAPVVLEADVTTPEILQLAEQQEPPDPDEGLHVLAYTPAGEVRPALEGIKVLFDHSMIAMTDVDPDKHPVIPMVIEPAVDGTFTWFGTKGFVYRFAAPLPMATRFTVRFEKGLAALDGKALEKKFEWTFTTPTPQVETIHPTNLQPYVPPLTPVKIVFSQPMQHVEVERQIQCETWPMIVGADYTKAKAEDQLARCDFSFAYQWTLDDKGRDVLTATPQQVYPQDCYIKVSFPKGLPPQVGTQGMANDWWRIFSTAGDFFLERIWVANPYPFTGDEEPTLIYLREPPKDDPDYPDPRYEKPTGDLCFRFSAPIDRQSFESAFALVVEGQTVPDPTFPISYYYQDAVPPTEAEQEAAKTPMDLPHLTGCLSTDLKFHTKYTIERQHAVLNRLGVAMPTEQLPEAWAFETQHAGLEAQWAVTKKLLNAQRLPKLPFASMNADRMRVTVSRCVPNRAAQVAAGAASCADEEEEADAGDGEEGEDDASADDDTPWSKTIPIVTEYNRYYNGAVDLATWFPQLQPGLYEIEAIFYPMAEITKHQQDYVFGIAHDTEVSVAPVTVRTSVILTNTALVMKRFENHLVVWALDIATGAPRAQLPIQLWQYDDLAVSGMTDAEGVFRVDHNQLVSSDSLVVLADDPKAFSILHSDDSLGITPEAFGLAYERPRFLKNYFAFIHTDRPLYRPEQTVHFSAFLRGLRDGRYFLAPDLHEVMVQIDDAYGERIFRERLPVSSTGVVSGELLLGDDAIPRGRYQLRVSIPTNRWIGEAMTQHFTKAFYVASYKKPDFKMDLTPERTEYVSGEPIRLTATGSYFFGAPLANAEIEWSIRQDGYRFAPKGYEDFQFVDEQAIQEHIKTVDSGGYEREETFAGDWGEVTAGVYSTDSDSRLEDPKIKVDRPAGPSRIGASARVVPAKDAGLNDDGLFVVEYTPDLSAFPTSQIYTAVVTANEWGQEVSAVADLRIHKSQVYVGLKPQQWVYRVGDPMAITVATLDPQAAVVGQHKVQVQIYKRDYMSIKKRDSSGNWSFVSEPKDTLVRETSLTTDALGVGVIAVPAEEGGTYRIVANTQDAQGHSMQAAVHVGVGGDPDSAWELGAENRLALRADQPRYRVGDTAQLLVPFPTRGMVGLLTIERAGIVEQRRIEFGAGENLVAVPIREDFVPNVYASLLLFRPEGEQEAMMKLGVVELPVEPESKRLTITMTPERAVYAPRDTVRIALTTTDAGGRGVPADVIVSVADESVLRLLDYESPDLVRRFFFPRTLGVTTAMNMVHYKSGDAGEGPSAQKKRNKFLDTAYFAGQVQTDAQGHATIEFPLPDNITTWVAEALAATVDTKVGSQFTTLRTTLPTFVRPILPRFLAVEDEARAIVMIENAAAEPYTGALQIQVSGGAELTTPAEQAITIDAGDRTAVPIGLRGVRAERSVLNISTRAADGTAMDAMELPLPVYDRSLPALYNASGATYETVTEELTIPEGARLDRGGFELVVGTTPMHTLANAIDYLLQYPYGCSEQRTSALIGLWHLVRYLETDAEAAPRTLPPALLAVYTAHYPTGDEPITRQTIRAQLQRGLSELYGFQKGNGGFGFWKTSEGDVLLSADIARTWQWFAESGVSIDDEQQQRLSSYLLAIMQGQRPLVEPTKDNALQWAAMADGRAELAWGTVAAAPAQAEANVRALLKHRKRLGPRGLAALALTMHEATMQSKFSADDRERVIDALRDQAEIRKHPRGRLALWHDAIGGHWDDTTITAVALQALVAADPNDTVAEDAARYLLMQAQGNHFGHTLATREALIALWRYALRESAETGQVHITAQVGAKEFAQALPVFSPTDWLEVKLGMAELAALPASTDANAGTGVSVPASPLFNLHIAKPKEDLGAIYYHGTLRAYFPMAQVPRREDGIIVAREFYALDDVREATPLTQFVLGQNYKASLTVLLGRSHSQVLVEHLLPAGFEPVDFGLSTSNPELQQALREAEDADESPAFTPEEFGYQEIHDDRVMWSADWANAGIYRLRHVVRAATVGQFQAPGATAQPFYDTTYHGRSRSLVVEVVDVDNH